MSAKIEYQGERILGVTEQLSVLSRHHRKLLKEIYFYFLPFLIPDNGIFPFRTKGNELEVPIEHEQTVKPPESGPPLELEFFI